MVAEPRTWVDVEAAVRAWARGAMPSVSGRVFFAFAERADLPQIVVWRLGGPDDRCLVQFDVWANTKAEAAGAAAELATALDGLIRYVGAGALLHGAVVIDARWMPDDTSDLPRYIVDATVTATAAE